MSIIKTKIGGFKARWVLRHRWEKGSKSTLRNYTANQIRSTLKLSIWAKRYEAVGRGKGLGLKETFANENMVNCYMIGLDLIVCKVWVDFSFRPTLGN
jgi:hypothetical protein